MTRTKAERRAAKSERRNQRYLKVKAAETEILRRVTLALGRLQVNIQSPQGGIPAQFLHAVHYLERGWAGDSRTVPPASPDVTFSHEEAEKLALTLHQMVVIARNAKSTFGEAE